MAAPAVAGAEAGGPNPVAVENQKPGDPAGAAHLAAADGDGVQAAVVTARPCNNAGDQTSVQLEGFASASSVNKGGQITLFVKSRDPAVTQYDATIYRQGWYGGAGATRITQINNQTALTGADPAQNATTGAVDAAWGAGLTVNVGADWVSGVYLAVLTPTTGADPTKAGNILFVVRDDASASKILYVLPTATYQALNDWGGKSLNEFSSAGAAVGALAATEPTSKRAVEASFNRPYCSNQGQGLFPGTDSLMVHFLERDGYDVSYATSEDLETNASLMANHKVFVSAYNDAVPLRRDAHPPHGGP